MTSSLQAAWPAIAADAPPAVPTIHAPGKRKCGQLADVLTSNHAIDDAALVRPYSPIDGAADSRRSVT
jgi:hypothetical protein